MGIDQTDRLADMTDASLPILNKILEDNANKTEGTIFMDRIPAATEVPSGRKIIVDDGAGTKRIYWKTAKGNLGFITLT